MSVPQGVGCWSLPFLSHPIPSLGEWLLTVGFLELRGVQLSLPMGMDIVGY